MSCKIPCCQPQPRSWWAGRGAMNPSHFLNLLCESRDFLLPAREMVLVKGRKSSNKGRLYFEGIGTCFCTTQEVICMRTKWVKNATSVGSITTLKECRGWKMPHHYQPVPVCWSLLSWPALEEKLIFNLTVASKIPFLCHWPTVQIN